MTHKWHRRQRLLLHMGKYYCSIQARSRNSFTVSKELKTIGTKSTRLTSRLQRCDRKKAKETTSHASFGETLLLHKGEKQKLLHFQNKVSKDRDYKLRVQCRIYKHVTHKRHRTQRFLPPLWKYSCSIRARSRNSFTFKKKVSKDRDHKQRVQGRIYKHVTHKWHRRQQLLLPLGKNYCSIKARSRNSFTVRMELDTIETKSTCLTSKLQRIDPQTAQDTTFAASFVEILLFHKG